MKNRKPLLKCKETGKISFTSEAQAQRRVDKYKDIQREYYCTSCDGWHLTSLTLEEALNYECLNDEEKENMVAPEEITIEVVAAKLKELKEKLK